LKDTSAVNLYLQLSVVSTNTGLVCFLLCDCFCNSETDFFYTQATSPTWVNRFVPYGNKQLALMIEVIYAVLHSVT